MEASRNESAGAVPETVSATKRTLLKAGWVAPVILAVGVPVSGFAQQCSTLHPDSTGTPDRARVDLPGSGGSGGKLRERAGGS